MQWGLVRLSLTTWREFLLSFSLFLCCCFFKIKFLVFFLYSIIDRLDGVRLLWSLLKSNNPNVSLIFLPQHFHPQSNFTDKVYVQEEPVA